MNKLKLVLVTLALSIGSQVLAADGSSGCGPGWYLFTENSLVSSSLRGTTNGVLAPVTTIGMTFGTSNCTRHKLVLKEKETLHFVEQNYFELKTQVARGGGAYVTALAQTMGCVPGAEVQLGQKLQQSYQSIFPMTQAPRADSSLIEVYKIILQNSELSEKCDSTQLS